MNHSINTSFVEYSKLVSDLFLVAKNFHNYLKKVFGHFGGIFISLTIGLPLMVSVYIILTRLIYRMRKELKDDFEISSNNYKDLKLEQQQLNQIADKLSKYKKADIKNVSFMLRPIIGRIIKFVKIVDRYRFKLNEKIRSLDNGVNGKDFKMIKENDLWVSRTTAYEYIL